MRAGDKFVGPSLVNAMGRALLVLAVGIYAFWIAYGSLVCGPAGLQLVGNASGTGWGDVLGVGVVRPGRESGWLANFFLLIPFGFLLMAATRFQRVQPRVSAITSFLLCLLFILAVKYAQLYFPSRTAALNNIPAQAFGAAVGHYLVAAVSNAPDSVYREELQRRGGSDPHSWRVHNLAAAVSPHAVRCGDQFRRHIPARRATAGNAFGAAWRRQGASSFACF